MAEEDEDIDLTPMIDVTFLLLIFFMITSLGVRPQLVDLPTAANADAEPSRDLQAIHLTKDGQLAFSAAAPGEADKESVVSIDDLPAKIQQMQDELGVSDFILKADAGARAEDVTRIMQALAQAGITRIKVGVQGED